MAKKGCILVLAKFKFCDLELYLWCNHVYAVTYRSAFSVWRTLARRNWEWRLWEVDRRQLYSRLPCFRKYLEPNHRVRIELRARKDQHRGSLCCGCDTCQPLVRYSWDEGGHLTWSTSTSTVLTLEYRARAVMKNSVQSKPVCARMYIWLCMYGTHCLNSARI